MALEADLGALDGVAGLVGGLVDDWGAPAGGAAGAASAPMRPDSTPMDRSSTGNAGRMPSANHAVPPANATSATCGQPPTRRVQDSTTAGAPPPIVVGRGAPQSKRLSRLLRHGPVVARPMSASAPAGPPRATRPLGCCQVPQKMAAPVP